MRRIISVILLCVLLAAAAVSAGAATPLLVDNADLLSAAQEETLLSALEASAQQLGMDVVVVTTDSLEGKSARAYADDWYDYNDYSADGVLLLVSMSTREWYITTTGRAISDISNGEVDRLGDRLADYLSDGEYLQGFLFYAQQVVQYASEEQEAGSSGIVGWLICIGIGMVAAFISVMVMKGKMKTVRSQSAASSYVTDSRYDTSRSRDLFLFSHVSRTAKAQSNGTHRGSSGRSHGGGGGRF